MADILVGSVAVGIVPSAQGFPEALRAQLVPSSGVIGGEIGKNISAAIMESLGMPLSKWADTQASAASGQGAKVGETFATGFKRRVEEILATLPEAKIGANITEADAKINALRDQLETLSTKVIGVDLTDAQALAKLDELKVAMRDLGTEAPVIVRANIDQAVAKVDELRAVADKPIIVPVTTAGGAEAATKTEAEMAAAGARGGAGFSSGFSGRTTKQIGSSVSGIGKDAEGKLGQAGLLAGNKFSGEFGSALGGMATGPVGKIAAIVAGIAVVSAHVAANFNEDMTKLSTGAGEAFSNLKSDAAGIKGIAMETGTSLKQLTDGMFMINSAGYHGADGLNVMRAAAEGAKVGGADLAVVSNALTTVMTDFNLKTTDSNKVMSGLNAIVSSGKVHMDDLAGSLSRVMPTAAALKIPFSDIGGGLATLTGEGISAKLASMGLNTAMLALAAPSAIASKTMSAMGISAKSVADTLRKHGLIAALDEVAQAALRAGPKGSPAYVAALKDMVGGNRGLQVALGITGDHLSTAQANAAKVAAAYGTASKDVTGWAHTQEDFNQKLDRFKQVAIIAFETIGEKCLPVLSKMADWILDKLVPAVQGFITKYGPAFKLAFTVIGIAIEIVWRAISTLVGWLNNAGLLAPLAALVVSMVALKKLGVFNLGFKLVGMGGRFAEMFTGGAKATIDATAMQTAGGTMSEAAAAMNVAADNMLRAAGMADLAGRGGGIAKTVEGDAGKVAPAVAGGAGVAGEAGIAAKVLTAAKTAAPVALVATVASQVAGALWNKISPKVAPVVAAKTTGNQIYVPGQGTVSTTTGGSAYTKTENAWARTGAMAGTGAAAGAVAGSVIPGVGTAIGAGVGAAAGLIGGVIKDPTAALTGVKDLIKGIGTDITHAFDFSGVIKDVQAVGGWFKNIYDSSIHPVSMAVGAIRTGFESLTGPVQDAFKSITDALGFGSKANEAGSLVQKLGAAFKVMGDVAKVAGAIIKVAIDVIGVMVKGTITFIETLIKNFVKFGVFKDIFKILGDSIKVVGLVIGTIIDLLTGKWGAAWKNIEKIGGLLVSIFATSLKLIFNLVQAFAMTIWASVERYFKVAVNALSIAWSAMVNFFTGTIPSWFKTVIGHFQSAVVSPIHSAINNFVGFFTATIPSWFKTVVAWWQTHVSTPIHTFIFTTLPGFFTSTIPNWFKTAWTWWQTHVSNPLHTFIFTTLPGFFTSTIPTWFKSAATWWNTHVSAPLHTFIFTALPGYFTSTIPGWFKSVIGVFTSQVINPIKNFIMTTIPGWFTSTIPHWFDKLPSSIENSFRTGIDWIISKINIVLGKVGLSIPQVSGGGVFPGYAPGHDTILARVSPGEGVLVPEAVQEVGADWVHGMNAKYGKGRRSTGMNFAGGGIPGAGLVKNIIHTAESLPGDVISFGKDAFAKLVSGALRSGFDAIWGGAIQPAENALSAKGGTAGKFGAMGLAEIKAGVDTILGKRDAATDGAVGGGSGAQVAAFAKTFATGKNHPYVTGGQGPGGWDCSGFSAYVYEHFGYFPGADKVRYGTSESQFSDPLLQTSGAQTGALVFFNDGVYANPGHVGVMINSSSYAGADSPQVGTVVAPASGAVGYRVPKGGFVTESAGKGNLIANASSIGAYLLSHGANKIAAAGIMGNMLQESGGNWNVGGGGLIQITGANPTSLGQSLAQTISYINANGGMGPINAATNVAMATELFMSAYERPATATENLARRLAGATAAYAAGYAKGTGPGGAAPGWGLVGEEGMELVRFHGGEDVIPHGMSMAALSGMSGYAGGTGSLSGQSAASLSALLGGAASGSGRHVGESAGKSGHGGTGYDFARLEKRLDALCAATARVGNDVGSTLNGTARQAGNRAAYRNR